MAHRYALPTDALPFLTADLSGIGGEIKTRPEDFVVEELPRYEPCGEGTHVFFMIEKRRLTTPEAVRRVARALDRLPRDIGYAGLKDARGVTRQVFSVEHVEPERVAELADERFRVLWTRRHTNKLKMGHLAGNRFEIRVRGCGESAAGRARRIIDVLRRRGVPNYYGLQRFGARGLNATIGRAALRGAFDEALGLILGCPLPGDDEAQRLAREAYDAGDYAACEAVWPPGFGDEARLVRHVARARGPGEAVWRRINPRMRTLYYSALQSELFNRVLAGRINGIDRVETGDVAWLTRNGACFAVTDAATEQPRCAAFEISPTGPMFGSKMTPAQGEPGRREARVLQEADVDLSRKRTPDGIRLEGARRPLRVRLADPEVADADDEHGPHLLLRFSLPAGAYATSVGREICKS